MKLLAALIITSLICGCSSKKSKNKTSSGSSPSEVVPGATDGAVPADTATSMKYVSPADGSEKLVKGASFDIILEFINPSATASWSLFYTPSKDSVVGGLPILEDLPASTTKVSWDTSFVDPGVYYVYVVFTSEDVTNVYFAPGSFKFEGNLDLNKAPVVSIASPAGDRAYAPGDSVPITFNVVDADNDPLSIKVEYTSNGSQWELIEDNIAADVNQVQWSIPTDAPQSARYRVRVVASDGKQSGEAINAKVFGVTLPPVIYTGQISVVFNENCTAACHISTNVMTPLLLDAYMPANLAKQSILDRTRAGVSSPMPPKNDAMGRTLDDAERDLIQLWIWNNGAQN